MRRSGFVGKVKRQKKRENYFQELCLGQRDVIEIWEIEEHVHDNQLTDNWFSCPPSSDRRTEIKYLQNMKTVSRNDISGSGICLESISDVVTDERLWRIVQNAAWYGSADNICTTMY